MIVPMKKLTLAALLEHREAILQALQSICAVQLISIGEGEQSSAAAEGRVQRLQSAEELLKPYAGKAGFGPKPEATRQELEEDIQPALEICAELEGLQRRIAQNGSDTEKRRLQLGSLLPWADMTDPLEKVHSTASIKVMTGTVPAEGVKALMETGALVQLYGGEKERAALVICPNEEYAGIAPSIRATGFQEKGFGDIRGTASENIQRLRTEIEALEAERAQLEARLAAFAPKREEIRRALDGAAIDRDREQSKEALAHTNTAFLLTGWVREDMTEKVRREIEKITDVYYLGLRHDRRHAADGTLLLHLLRHDAFGQRLRRGAGTWCLGVSEIPKAHRHDEEPCRRAHAGRHIHDIHGAAVRHLRGRQLARHIQGHRP